MFAGYGAGSTVCVREALTEWDSRRHATRAHRNFMVTAAGEQGKGSQLKIILHFTDSLISSQGGGPFPPHRVYQQFVIGSRSFSPTPKCP